MRYIVTGCAGFIGSHVTYRLLSEGHDVYGIDNFSGSYPAHLSKMRIDRLYELEGSKIDKFVIDDPEVAGSFECHDIGIASKWLLENVKSYLGTLRSFDAILHFAATPGVRRSIEEPQLYVENNIGGTVVILELARELEIPKVLLASSSSVYGNSAGKRLREDGTLPKWKSCNEEQIMYPISPYAASKVAMEMMGLTYHNLYGMDILIPRYFSVYGSYGRPDMAYFIFMKLLSEGNKPIEVFGDGQQLRDMTYIDDVVEATRFLLDRAGYQVVNVGSSNPVSLDMVIELISEYMNVCSYVKYGKPKPGDPFATCADITRAKQRLNWTPTVSIEEGIKRTVEWFTEVYWPEVNVVDFMEEGGEK